MSMWDQGECWPCPVASKGLRKVIKELSYMQQFPMMKNCSAECIVQEGSSSLERNSMETNLLKYQERTVFCSIISSTFLQFNFKFSFMRRFCHYCISPSVFFSAVYEKLLWQHEKDQNSGNAYNLNQSLLVPACEQPFSYIKCIFSRH